MIRYVKIDLTPQEFKLINQRLIKELDGIKPIEKNPKFSDEIFSIFQKILPRDFIFILGYDLTTNLAYAHKNLCILKIESKIQVIFYRPRPYGYPSLKAFQYFTDKQRVENLNPENPNLEKIEVLKNSLLSEEKLKEFENFLKLYFNINRENKVIYREKEVDRDSNFLLVLKSQFYLLSECLFLHFVMSPKRKFFYHIPDDIEIEQETKQLQINFELNETGKNYQLLIFEKLGKDISYTQKIKEKWKEFLVFLCMLGLLLTLTVCKPDREYGNSIFDGVCRNRDNVLVMLGGFVLITVVGGYVIKKINNKASKKFNQ